MEDVDKKLDDLKKDGSLIPGKHEVHAVVKGKVGKASTLDKVGSWAKEKAIETTKSVILPAAKDAAFNTVEDFFRRLIYKDDDYGYSGSGRGYSGYGYRDYSSYGVRPYTGRGSVRKSNNSRGYSPAEPEGPANYNRIIILDSVADVKGFEDEVNRIMFSYGQASLGDCYAAADMGSVIIPTDFNVGFNAENNPNGVLVDYKEIRERDESGRPVTRFRVILPRLEDLPR